MLKMADDIITTVKLSDLIDKYGSLVDDLTKHEFNGLKDSIAVKGIEIPIVINENNEILDGHHRTKAARELGIDKGPVLVKRFDNKLAEESFALRTNIERRHWNDFQKAKHAIKLQKIESERARQRQKDLAGTRPNMNMNMNNDTLGSFEPKVVTGKADGIIASMAGLSSTTYTRAKFVIERADKETKKRLETGKLSISKSYNYYKRKEERETAQREDLSNPAQTDKINLIYGDFRDKCKDIPDNSIPLIFTDPEYNVPHLPLYKDLGEVAARVLVDGGSLFTYFNQAYLRQVYDYLESSGLTYHWLFAVIHSGASANMHEQKVTVTWKPLLWFRKGPNLRMIDGYIKDSILSKPPNKALHDWAQSPVDAALPISKLTVQGDTILDPMMGSGTTGVAALMLNRKFTGMDNDKKAYNSAKNTLAKY